MNLKEEVKKSGFKQVKIAELIGVHHVNLSKHLNGEKTLSDEKVRKLKELLSRIKEVG